MDFRDYERSQSLDPVSGIVSRFTISRPRVLSACNIPHVLNEYEKLIGFEIRSVDFLFLHAHADPYPSRVSPAQPSLFHFPLP